MLAKLRQPRQLLRNRDLQMMPRQPLVIRNRLDRRQRPTRKVIRVHIHAPRPLPIRRPLLVVRRRLVLLHVRRHRHHLHLRLRQPPKQLRQLRPHPVLVRAIRPEQRLLRRRMPLRIRLHRCAESSSHPQTPAASRSPASPPRPASPRPARSGGSPPASSRASCSAAPETRSTHRHPGSPRRPGPSGTPGCTASFKNFPNLSYAGSTLVEIASSISPEIRFRSAAATAAGNFFSGSANGLSAALSPAIPFVCASTFSIRYCGGVRSLVHPQHHVRLKLRKRPGIFLSRTIQSS